MNAWHRRGLTRSPCAHSTQIIDRLSVGCNYISTTVQTVVPDGQPLPDGNIYTALGLKHMMYLGLHSEQALVYAFEPSAIPKGYFPEFLRHIGEEMPYIQSEVARNKSQDLGEATARVNDSNRNRGPIDWPRE
jgi:hypothetical protein